MAVNRYDAGTLKSSKRLDNGWLRAPARLTRVGVFEYPLPNGKTFRELRLPEEVFAEDSLESFAQVPITDDHPSCPLDASNTKTLAVGNVSEVRADGKFVAASLLITDEATIAKVLAGKQELSCGYTCDLDETPGTYGGQKYDAVQRRIRGNHVAIVDKGRAGPEAKLRLDGTAIETINDPVVASGTSLAGVPVQKIKIDGLEYEVSDECARSYLTFSAAQAKALATAEARADSASAELKKIPAPDPGAFRAAVAARVSLEASAAKVLGAQKLDAMSDQELKSAVVKKLDPDAKLEGKSADYIDARFDAAIEQAAKKNPGLEAARAATEPHVDADPEATAMPTGYKRGEVRADEDLEGFTLEQLKQYGQDRRVAWLLENRNAWKKPATRPTA
jgi:hypothetical protein